MEKFSTLTSKVVPLPIRDVDTDMIIPAQFMTSISKEGYGENVFRRLRDEDANFPVNLPQFQGSEILVADENFGCGSSREHAVWALTSWGFRVIIAKSFADIFFGNSAKNGLLLITMPDDDVESFQKRAASGNFELSVSLSEQTVTDPDGKVYKFDYDPFRKHCLLEGLEDLDYIFSHGAEIAAFRERQEKHRYTSTAQVSSGD